MINLALKRKWLTLESTIGELFVDGHFECFVLEDRYRPPPEAKVKGATAIPVGRFRVLWTDSPRFGRKMLLVDRVPGFEGIRIHGGNDKNDTEGCLLPGRVRQPNRVLESVLALQALEKKLVPYIEAGGEVWIDISLEPATS